MANTAKPVAEQAAVPARKERPTRTPVGGARDILTVHGKDPNYVYRWVRNDEGRVEWFQDRGYEVVTGDQHEVGQKTVDSGSQLGSAVTRHGGGGKKLILMRTPKEYYDEDQAAKEAAIAATEATMKQPMDGGYGSVQITRRR